MQFLVGVNQSDLVMSGNLIVVTGLRNGFLAVEVTTRLGGA